MAYQPGDWLANAAFGMCPISFHIFTDKVECCRLQTLVRSMAHSSCGLG